MKKILAFVLCTYSTSLHSVILSENAAALVQRITNNLSLAEQDVAIQNHWSNLATNHYVEHIGPDADFRHLYVNLQGLIEYSLAQEKDIKITGIIHTATPPTPLRTDGTILHEGLVAEAIAKNPKLIETVTKRANILRQFLASGKRLYAYYPSSALSPSLSGIDIYRDLLNTYKACLMDRPFDGDFPKKDLTGATYLIEIPEPDNTRFELYVFSIMALQANDPKDDAQWAMWFGPISDPKVEERYNQILSFLRSKDIKID